MQNMENEEQENAEGNSVNESVQNRIQKMSHQLFNKLFKQKYKKTFSQYNIYTVICSITIRHKNTNQFNIISLACGTKCLPHSLYQQHKGNLLKDMHAQILAIKSFRNFLISQILKQQSQYLLFDEKRNKKCFNTQKYQIIMYSSELFCGDSSICQDQGIFSGGKPLKYFNCKNIPNQKYEKCILRLKPGRNDLPPNKLSLSLSCSDKLGLYNLMGIQGKQLFEFIRPVFIDKFIVKTNHTQNKEDIKNGIDFYQRLSKLTEMSTELIERKIFNIIVNGKQRRISSQFRRKIFQVITVKDTQKDFKKQRIQESHSKIINKQGFQVALIYQNDCIQWINGKTGLPEGCSLNNYLKKGKISQFSKRKYLQNIQKIKQKIKTKKKNNQQCQKSDHHQDEEQIFKYKATKDRIKLLFGIWTDNFKKESSTPSK